jgi:2-polyprenyl-3-methyl-5-hydroxy-6-metoxy-1,4-benzoquinol methylase
MDNKNVASYFSDTDKYAVRNPIIKLRRTVLHDMIGDIEGKSILDVGCGEGSLTIDYVSENKLTFLDITSEMLELVKSRIPEEFSPNASFVKADIMEYDTDLKFDIIVCVGVFAHFTDLDALIKKLMNLSSEKGILIIQYTNAANLITKLNLFKIKYLSKSRYSHKLNIHSTRIIRKILKQNRLERIRTKAYWPIFPFFSPFSYSIQIKLLKFFYKNAFLSYIGSEKVYLLANKQDKPE